MATGTVPATVVPPPLPATDLGREHERVIHRQLGRTSFHVRLVDLASSLATLSVGAIGFLLAAAFIDHWLFGLGIVGRTLALGLLVGGVAWYTIARIGPLLVKSINPSYAARTIEEATPSLKNSLINFLLLRQDRSGVRGVIYDAVEAKAATDIAAVPVEATIDRSRLIRAGYILCGVMALFAAYKILSPKDPFLTVARVALPWADIARPSRVEITDVTPGSAEVYHGQVVDVSAELKGVREGSPVTLLFTTADGQAVDRPVVMTPAPGGLRYGCQLPPPAAGQSLAGMQQGLTYRIVAGDAQSPTFELRVVAAPTIIVERLEYQYPPYTKKPPQSVPQQGDVHGLEGTRVEIHAVANQPIKSAWIELDPGANGLPPELVQLKAEGTRATGSIVLQLKTDRQTPWHAAYQVRFYNERGQQNDEPILHKIEVVRDLPPEVQLLRPQKVRIEVPADGEATLEVRGVDPDFGLSRLRIEGMTGERKIEIDLLAADAGQPPQATVPLVFRPREHALQAGDELKYVALAEDNRTSPLTGKSEPGVARTSEYTLVVVASDRPSEGADGQPQAGENPNPQAGEQPNADRPPPGERNPQEKQPGDKDNQPGEKQPGEKPPEAGADQPQPGEKQGEKQPGEKQGEQQPGEKQQGEKQPGEKQPGEQQPGSQPMAGEQQSGEPMQGEQSGEPMEGGGSGQGQSGTPMPGGPMSDSPQEGGGQQPGSESGGQGGQQGNDSQQSGQPGEPRGDAAGEPGGQGQPGGEGQRQGKAHEGEAIQEIAKQFEKELAEQGQQPQGQNGQGQKQQGQTQPGQKQPGEPMPGEAGADQPKEGQSSEGQPMGQQPGAGDKSAQPMPMATQQPGDRPQPGEGQAEKSKSGEGQPKEGQPGEGQQGQPMPGEKQGQPMEKLPGDKQGDNPSQQPGGAGAGGKPMGANKTNPEQKSPMSEGEPKDPGAGQNGDEGAGSKSQDKTGSGAGQKANRDRPKEQKSDGSDSKEGNTSGVSQSPKQSDSQGGESGDQSGGGKKGAGQSAGQEGNDSAGSKSAADQGAGAAAEKGSGETGDKAGTQQEAPGQTGQSGNQAGQGSQTRGDKQGQQSGKSGQPPERGEPAGKQSDQAQSEGKGQRGPAAGGGGLPQGGGDGSSAPVEQATGEAPAADAANLEYARKATELALEKLKDQEHNPDPELLDKLGWSREDLAEFLRRWEALQQSASKTPAGRRELDEALRSLGLRDPANRKRAGGTASDNQRDLLDGGGRSSPPAKYRDLFDAFRKGAARAP